MAQCGMVSVAWSLWHGQCGMVTVAWSVWHDQYYMNPVSYQLKCVLFTSQRCKRTQHKPALKKINEQNYLIFRCIQWGENTDRERHAARASYRDTQHEHHAAHSVWCHAAQAGFELININKIILYFDVFNEQKMLLERARSFRIMQAQAAQAGLELININKNILYVDVFN